MPKASSKGLKDSPKEYYVPMENPYGAFGRMMICDYMNGYKWVVAR